MYFDAHNHLHDSRFDDCREPVLEACAAAGVIEMAVDGTHPDDWPQVANLVELAAEFGIRIWPQFGVHPWKVMDLPEDWPRRQADFLARADAGLGEIGLDRWKRDLDWGRQVEVFVEQFETAGRDHLPVSLHCLRAWDPLIELIREISPPDDGFLLHGYGGDWSLATRLLELHERALFSFSGSMLHPRKEATRQAFERLPPENVVIESDAPDMAPPENLIEAAQHDADGQPLNSPALLPRVLESADFLPPTGQLRQNARRFFCRGHEETAPP